MIIIPAIDIKNGKCVRLTYGKAENETVYSQDPVKVAMDWQAKGAKRLHIVDLDGAFEGLPKNLDIVREIRHAVRIPIEFGGGLRTQKAIDSVISIGIDFVILGTVAVKEPQILQFALRKHKDKIIVGIDAKGGKVSVDGWLEDTLFSAVEFAQEMKTNGVERIVFTDIARDGALQGPNIDALKDMAMNSKMKVIASGGVTTLEDIKRIKELEKIGVEGVIIGKALYTGNIKLEDALKLQ